MARFDFLSFVMQVEEDPSELSIEEYVDGMAAMVQCGMVWQLQGGWGRAAHALIEGGIIDRHGSVLAYPEPV